MDMLRIVGRISIFGSLEALKQLERSHPILGGSLQQVGAARSNTPRDLWVYGGRWFSFRFELLDEELLDYLTAHYSLGPALAALDEKAIAYAMLTLTPVDQTDEVVFSCFLGLKTLSTLSNLGLALEIAPAAVMPKAPYWLP